MTDTFLIEKKAKMQQLAESRQLRQTSIEWMAAASRFNYSHHFTWLGLPIIQFPQDIIAIQEIVWRVRPQLIIETGIARGGSLILHASLLELIGGEGMVCGIDIDIRPHNRTAIESHPLARRVRLIEGSSTDEHVVEQARALARDSAPVMVILDSDHRYQHVRRELDLYAPLVTAGSYLVVLDTIIEHFPEGYFSNREWDVGNNPAIAVREFLQQSDRFAIDEEFESKLLISVAPGGYLKCLRDA